MPVIAVINRKGGSGKSTLATHLAAWCATNGIAVMLGDVDRQQSTQSWLRRREARRPTQQAPIVGWNVDPRNVLRPPAGITRVVLDTPGGLRGLDLARVVMFTDVIVMPVCNSAFDRESAAECHAELLSLPRVASGRCKVAAVGMRVDARTKGAEVLAQWAERLKLPYIGVLRETQGYVRCVEQGLTLFDLPVSKVQDDLAQWKPIIDWLEPMLLAAQQAAAGERAVRPTTTSYAPRADAPAPSRRSPVTRPAELAVLPEPLAPRPRGGLFDWLPIPRFLQRDS
ncbi:MAG TPA: ParA family protein [Albitalea sp.]|nr:ParA family protein [Albitalea sp.]